MRAMSAFTAGNYHFKPQVTDVIVIQKTIFKRTTQKALAVKIQIQRSVTMMFLYKMTLLLLNLVIELVYFCLPPHYTPGETAPQRGPFRKG